MQSILHTEIFHVFDLNGTVMNTIFSLQIPRISNIHLLNLELPIIFHSVHLQQLSSPNCLNVSPFQISILCEKFYY